MGKGARWCVQWSCCAASIAAPLLAQGASPIVAVQTGALAGYAEPRAGVVVFKGIPYARPPIGALRWRPPAPAERWAGVRQATAFGHSCLQPPPAPGGIYSGGMAAQDEDCLTLNVWMPRSAHALPVMVWIHGGALVGGSSSEPLYDGTKLAQHGIIVVSINYRLGLLGFFAHPALSAESPRHVSGNYGLLDQIAALRWVQSNIAAFGGDPAKVTIAGESAGALSVMTLIASPAARGLFARAIAESGYMPSYAALHDPVRGLPSAEAAGLRIAAAVGATDASSLRAADLSALFKSALANGWQPEPVIDGQVLRRQIAEAYAQGEQAKVPLLAGFNEGEIRSLLFLMPKAPATKAAYETDIEQRFGARAPSFRLLYPGADPRAAVMASIRDGLYGWAAQYAVARQAAAGQPAYLYYFRHSTPAERARDLAAFHASELPYVFGKVSEPGALSPTWPTIPQTTEEATLSDAMVDYWASFVRTGVPRARGEPAWPRYTAASPAYLDIGERPVAALGLEPEAFSFANDLVAERMRNGGSWRLNIGFSAYPAQPAARR